MTNHECSLLQSDTSCLAYFLTPPNTPCPPPPHPIHLPPPGPPAHPPQQHRDSVRLSPAPGLRQLHGPDSEESAVSFSTSRSLRAFGNVETLQRGLLKGAMCITLIAQHTLYFRHTPLYFRHTPLYFRHTPLFFCHTPLFPPPTLLFTTHGKIHMSALATCKVCLCQVGRCCK
jgi:hypothetical protein